MLPPCWTVRKLRNSIRHEWQLVPAPWQSRGTQFPSLPLVACCDPALPSLLAQFQNLWRNKNARSRAIVSWWLQGRTLNTNSTEPFGDLLEDSATGGGAAQNMNDLLLGFVLNFFSWLSIQTALTSKCGLDSVSERDRQCFGFLTTGIGLNTCPSTISQFYAPWIVAFAISDMRFNWNLWAVQFKKW